VDSPVRTFLVLGYPAFDLVLVSLLLALRARTPGERGGIGTGVRVGYLVIVVCDSIFTMPAVRDGYRSGGILDTGWFAGYLAIAVAAWYGDGYRPERAARAAAGPVVVPDRRRCPDCRADDRHDNHDKHGKRDKHGKHDKHGKRLMREKHGKRGICRTCGADRSAALSDSDGCDTAAGCAGAPARATATATATATTTTTAVAVIPGAPPGPPAPAPTGSSLRTARAILPYLAAAFCLAGVLADGLDTNRRMDPVVLIAGAAVLVALVARQGLTLYENQRLTEDLRRAAETLQHHAYHDPLTGLANRALLTDRLEHALTQRQAEWEPVAVIFLDLDGFKGVNDSVGHETGDRVLVEAAGRISGSLRAGDTVARFGGDEFVIVLEVGTTVAGALVVAERIRGRLCEEYRIEGLTHRLGASIGVAFSEPGGTASNLLRRADAAMYRAKTAGRNRVVAEPLAETWAVSHGETAPINA
jgi:diguanylate cyclase (GGDEF)-like protein